MNAAPAAARPAYHSVLDPLELAYGYPLGFDSSVQPLARHERAVDPVVAMEAVLARALGKAPCLISFSGGRDSSALLALAARVARRDGLTLPVPATLRFPGSTEADEDEWQSVVIRHLDLPDWERIEVGNELDAVGPVATAAMVSHGLLWPFNTHFHLPIIERAKGGSVVTGFGGDEVARSSQSARAEQVLCRRRRPRPVDVAVVGLALSPVAVRAAVHRRRASTTLASLEWLTGEGRRRLSREYGRSEALIPVGWDRVLRRWIWPGRYFTVCRDSFSTIAAPFDVDVLHPFLDGGVLDALGQRGGFGGLGSRAEIMRLLFGDVLPSSVVERRTKASFTDPLWTATARRFAASWSGGGVDTRLVDTDVLRRHWAGDKIHVLSTSLLQAGWLHDHC